MDMDTIHPNNRTRSRKEGSIKKAMKVIKCHQYWKMTTKDMMIQVQLLYKMTSTIISLQFMDI